MNLDGGRIVLAPGPAIMQFLPNGVYVARGPWARENPALARNFRLAMNEALLYSQSHTAEVRALLPAAIRDIRLAIWSPVLDRKKLLQLARPREEVRDHQPAAGHDEARAGHDRERRDPEGRHRLRTKISLKLDKAAGKDAHGRHGHGRRLRPFDEAELPPEGPGVDRKTGVKKAGRITWTVRLRPGTYRFFSDANLEDQGIVQGRKLSSLVRGAAPPPSYLASRGSRIIALGPFD